MVGGELGAAGTLVTAELPTSSATTKVHSKLVTIKMMKTKKKRRI
jgi:hypothetical protein